MASEVVINAGATPPPGTPPNGGGAYTAEGVISSISHGDRSMKVNGIDIKIWDAPIYRGSQRVGISELSVGQRVGVKGNWVESKYVVATEVSVLGDSTPGPQPPPSGDFAVEGPISSISYGDPARPKLAPISWAAFPTITDCLPRCGSGSSKAHGCGSGSATPFARTAQRPVNPRYGAADNEPLQPLLALADERRPLVSDRCLSAQEEERCCKRRHPTGGSSGRFSPPSAP